MARGSGDKDDDGEGVESPGKVRENAARLMKRRRLELGRVDLARQLESAPEKGPYREMLQKALRSVDQQINQLA
jgi:hypothetical protein